MPRQGRIDFPGALHHLMVRGIERRIIFVDDQDREDMVRRLTDAIVDTATGCYAWAMLPNHFHLLVVSGKARISKVMQSVLTGYVVKFNRRHKRSGKLFQNRFHSILCEREAYLLELVRYIHLNPLRAGIVKGMAGLDKYAWSGHGVLMGKREAAPGH